MELVTRDRPNVSLRRHGEGGQWVVLSFPYDAHLVNLARSIPHRRFDWDTREWSAPVTDWAGIRVQDILERYPELEASDEVRRLAEGRQAPLDRQRLDDPPRRPRLVGAAHDRRSAARGAAANPICWSPAAGSWWR